MTQLQPPSSSKDFSFLFAASSSPFLLDNSNHQQQQPQRPTVVARSANFFTSPRSTLLLEKPPLLSSAPTTQRHQNDTDENLLLDDSDQQNNNNKNKNRTNKSSSAKNSQKQKQKDSNTTENAFGQDDPLISSHPSFTQEIHGSGITIPFFKNRAIAVEKSPTPSLSSFIHREGIQREDKAVLSLDWGNKGAKQFGVISSRNNLLNFLEAQEVTRRNFYVNVDPAQPMDLFFDVDGCFENQEEMDFWIREGEKEQAFLGQKYRQKQQQNNHNLNNNENDDNALGSNNMTTNNNDQIDYETIQNKSPFRRACDALGASVVAGLWRAIHRRLPALELYHVACFDACISSFTPTTENNIDDEQQQQQQQQGENNNNEDSAVGVSSTKQNSSTSFRKATKISFHIHFRLWDPRKNCTSFLRFDTLRDFSVNICKDIKHEGEVLDEADNDGNDNTNNNSNEKVDSYTFVSPSKWHKFIDTGIYTVWRAFRLPFNMKRLENTKLGQPLLPRLPRKSFSNVLENKLFELCSSRSLDDAINSFASSSSASSTFSSQQQHLQQQQAKLLTVMESLIKSTLNEMSLMTNPLSNFSRVEFDVESFDKNLNLQQYFPIFVLQFQMSTITRPELIPLRFFATVPSSDACQYMHLRRQRTAVASSSSIVSMAPQNTAAAAASSSEQQDQQQLPPHTKLFEMLRGKELLPPPPPPPSIVAAPSITSFASASASSGDIVTQPSVSTSASTSSTIIASAILEQHHKDQQQQQQLLRNRSKSGDVTDAAADADVPFFAEEDETDRPPTTADLIGQVYGVKFSQMPSVAFTEVSEFDPRHQIIKEIFKSLHPQFRQNLTRLTRVNYGDNKYLRMYYAYQKECKFCPNLNRAHKSSYVSLYITYGSVKVKCFSNDCHKTKCVVYPFVDPSKKEEEEQKLLQEIEKAILVTNRKNNTKSSENDDQKQKEKQQDDNNNNDDDQVPAVRLPDWVRLQWDNPALHISKRDILFPPLPDGEVLKRYAPLDVLRQVQAVQNARQAELNKREQENVRILEDMMLMSENRADGGDFMKQRRGRRDGSSDSLSSSESSDGEQDEKVKQD